MKKQIEISTLCLIVKDKNILLGKKKRGLGKGNWNGFGGRLETGESIEEAAIRETYEECGLKVLKLKKIGKILFKANYFKKDLLVYFFKVLKFAGKPKETNEMKPKWFKIENIPFNKMWEDDKYWMPLFLKNQYFTGAIIFGDNYSLIGNTIKKAKKYEIS